MNCDDTMACYGWDGKTGFLRVGGLGVMGKGASNELTTPLVKHERDIPTDGLQRNKQQ